MLACSRPSVGLSGPVAVAALSQLRSTPHRLQAKPRLPRCPAVCRPATALSASSSGPAPVDATSTAASGGRLSDRRLGELFLRLLPGWMYYAPVLLFPLVTVLAGLGAAYGPAAARWLSTQPLVMGLGPLAPLLAAAGGTQPWAGLLSVFASLLTALAGFVLEPVLDVLLGQDLRDPAEEEAVAGARGALYRAVLYAYVPLHLGMLAGLCCLLSTAATPPAAFLGATLSAGVAGGIQFTAAHELLHGQSRLDRACAGALLAAVGYMHWSESHLAHHVKVATPEDPASARPGEPLYAFLPRSIWGNLVDGYSAEAARLARRGFPLLSLHNRMLLWVGCPAALAAAAFLTCGWRGLAFAVGQAVVSVLMLETVNYVEHYGLQRQRLPDGRYERCGPQHSWNTSFMFTNAVTFRLQRHADHHQHGSKPFHLLRDSPESPQLPFSYPAAVLLALVPPLFMHVMDGRIDSYTASRASQQAAAASS